MAARHRHLVGVGSRAADAKALGAKVIGTSGSQEKLDKLKGMGLDLGIRTRSGDFAKTVMDATGGKGANLVVNNVGGSVFPETLRALALQGRQRPSATSTACCTRTSTSRRCTPSAYAFGVSNRLRTPEQRAVTVRGFAADILPFIAQGKIKPVIDRVFPFAELPARRPTWNRTRRSARSRCGSRAESL